MILIPRSTDTTAPLEHPYLRLRQSSPPMCSAMRESGHFHILPSTGAGQIVFSQERRRTGSSCRSEAGFPRWSPGAAAAAVGATLLRRRWKKRGISQEQQPSSYLKYYLHKAAKVQESMKLLAFCTSPSHLNRMI